MTDDDRESRDSRIARLRQQAEAALTEGRSTHQAAATEADLQPMIHELQVRQIELEMQNEELRAAQERLAISRQQYVDLYDFAPVGYVTIDEAGRITEANLTSASLLGVPRSRLIGSRLS